MCSIDSDEPDRPRHFSDPGAVANVCYLFFNERMGWTRPSSDQPPCVAARQMNQTNEKRKVPSLVSGGG
jgi:hypothetical protein